MSWPFVEAHHLHRGRLRALNTIYVHDMEALAGPRTAENVASWWHGPTSPETSAHVCVDTNSVVQCVAKADTAWAVPGGNANGFHIELAGFARNDRGRWLQRDDVLTWGACVAAEVLVDAYRHGITNELRRATAAELRDQSRTKMLLAGHNDATHAFATPGGHTDPGDNFPWDVFLDKVDWWLPNIHTIDFR